MIRLRPDIACYRTAAGYLLTASETALAIAADLDGEIAEDDARTLVLEGLAYSGDATIFDQPRLCEAMFAWDSGAELDFIVNMVGHRGQMLGLDVACGFGRLTLPLIARGCRLDAIDESLKSIEFLSERIPTDAGGRLYCTSIETFVSPGAYGYAFAAMNSLRYLESKGALRRHLRAMGLSLAKGSPYLACISIPASPQAESKQDWSFKFAGEDYRASWKRVRFCHLREQIIEEVEVRKANGTLVHAELQKQGHYSFDFLRSLFDRHEVWRWEATYRSDFQAVDMSADPGSGTFWLVLRRI
ncbi:methyltransferase domain-containing protein [Rubrivivax gelatinosus]|uniref:class I SAM-dependent methyltransferase n=1 Tax=Rubrivivax gelatinosus TaxID=28068 RepID=UPI001907A27A|nr:class I SAM-dependent methyltransferase [Rubrivivax gelatinosus]